MKIRDCRYCEYAQCLSPDDPSCDCYVEEGYYDHTVEHPAEEAKHCEFFVFCDCFPKT